MTRRATGRPAGFWTICWADSGGAGYSYDGFGQLTRRVQDGMVQDFVYDDEGRMVRASGQGRHGGHSTAYHYDAIGRRTAKVTRRMATDGSPLTDETRFVWEGMRMVQVLRDGTVRTYVYSPDSPYRPMARVDQPVVSVDGKCRAGSRRTVWHHHAHDNGQVYDVTSGNGDVVWEPRFSGFGEFRGSERHDDRVFDEPLRFAGQYADEETGLHYNTFRYYDPGTGRFVSQDPIGLAGGLNLYAYAPNPISWIDPRGLACSEGVNFSRRQLDKKFKHAVDFGITGNKNGPNIGAFEQAMKDHIDLRSTQAIQGKYRWADDVTHYFNPETGLNVMTDQSGNFISGWKLSPRQVSDLTSLGNVF